VRRRLWSAAWKWAWKVSMVLLASGRQRHSRQATSKSPGSARLDVVALADHGRHGGRIVAGGGEANAVLELCEETSMGVGGFHAAAMRSKLASSSA
jgi:hypothetical protein